MAALLALLLALGCASTPVPPIAESPVPLSFTVNLSDKPLFDQLHAHAIQGSSGWRARPFARIGNFVEARWCSPTVREAACSGGSVVNDQEPGTAWFQLATLHYDSSWPATFGVVWHAGAIPAEGIGVSTFYARNGASILGEGFGAQVLRVAGSRVTDTAALGQWELVLGASRLRVATTPDDEVRALLVSVDSYRQRVGARLAALRAQLDAAELSVWHEGPYLGRGIPPERTEASATPEEARALRAEGTAELARREQLLLDHAEAVHAGLARLFPAGAP
ncbi:MAG: hypothetical protein FJ095_17820 [Deltaproteobacteria bacterium]|nr:hypothetical protein [Deltaproteobacteria bacterium]